MFVLVYVWVFYISAYILFILGYCCVEGVLLILLGALFVYLATLKIRGAAGFYFKIISTLNKAIIVKN